MDDQATTKHALKRLTQAIQLGIVDGFHELTVVSDNIARGYVRLELSPGFISAYAPTHEDRAPLLASLGWRPPTDREPRWSQYLYPQRPRDVKTIARWIAKTIVEGLDCGPNLTWFGRELSDPPRFAHTEPTPTDFDEKLAEAAELSLASSPFEVHREGMHFDLGSVRHRHLAQLACSFSEGTLCACILHLVEPDRATVAAHLAANPTLHHAPYVFAQRGLTDGRRVLVLESKFAVPRFAVYPAPMGGALCGVLEPLIAAHRGLHASSR